MILLLAAVLFPAPAPQDTRTVVRTEKSEYNAALAKYKEAEAMIESDPLGAIDRLGEILSNPKLRILECLIKIEQRPAEYSDPYPFLPYQSRGTARVNQSKKLTGDAARRMMAAAIEDYTESVKRNVGPSGDLLKAAQARLAKLNDDVTSPLPPVKVDPVVKFREKWDPVIRDGRFKSARALIDKEGQELTDEQRKAFVATAEQQCRDYLTKEVADFRPRFINALGLGLETKTSDEFDLTFALPATAELIVSNPALDWVRQYLPAFREVQAQKAPAHSLAAAAVASAPLEERFENPWFKAIEGAVFQSLRSAVGAEVDQARDAAKAERQKARAQAEGYLGVWKGMTSKLDPKFVERHRFLADHERALQRLLEEFPTELAELDKIDPAVDAAFASDNPDADLIRVEETLAGLESRPNLSRESRQRLFTARVTVVALRGLLGGKSEEAVAGDLSAYRQKLRDAGGPGDVKKYGPRVEKVFAALR
ncbi:MAG TPA: hypothetical protein VMU54_20645 [Planctomycetota bacterium]|nr:hypothetical protein [Planctomycetota bacterium]